MAQLALMSNEADQIEVARYFENKSGHVDKAVMLYHKVVQLFMTVYSIAADFFS